MTKPPIDNTSSGFARALLENMVSVHSALQAQGVEVPAGKAVSSVFAEVADALSHLPLERLRADSDFVLHAEGPGQREICPGCRPWRG